MSDVNNANARISQQNINSNVYNTYGEKKIKKILAAPFFPETFLGREKDLKAIYRKLFKEENLLLLVNGQGGIGKTTLAAKYYLCYQNAYQHLAWIVAESSLINALLTLAVQLELSFPEAMENEARLNRLLNEMRNLKRPCLLVIDNVNVLEDLEKHYVALRSCPNFHILLTTRITEFEDAVCYKIKELPEHEALELFIKHYPKHTRNEDDLFKKIRTAVGGNTLVIELLAKNLRNSNRLQHQYSLTELLADLQKKGLLALSKSRAVGTSYRSTGELRKENPEAIIATMYDLSELDESEKKLLSVFSVLPAESILFKSLQTLFPGWDSLNSALLMLAQKGWLDYDEINNSFKISPVIQEIVKNKNGQILADCKNSIEALNEKLDYIPGLGHLVNASYQEGFMYARYAEKLIENFDVPDYELSVLLERLGSYYITTGNLPKALAYYERDIQLAKELYETNQENSQFKKGLAVSYCKLGNVQSDLGNQVLALNHYKDYYRLSKELHKKHPDNADYKNNLAITYFKLGETYANLDCFSKALRAFGKYNRLEKELYKEYPKNADFKINLAISYCRLGNIQVNLGNLRKALRHYVEYYNLSKELYDEYPENVEFKNDLARSYFKLAELHVNLGAFPKAIEYFEHNIQLTKELCEKNNENIEFKKDLALSYQSLGQFYETHMESKEKTYYYFFASKKLLAQLNNSFPEYVLFKKKLDWVKKKLSKFKN